MNKIQKALYQAPELSKFALNNDLSIMLSFLVNGTLDPIAEGEDEKINDLGKW